MTNYGKYCQWVKSSFSGTLLETFHRTKNKMQTPHQSFLGFPLSTVHLCFQIHFIPLLLNLLFTSYRNFLRVLNTKTLSNKGPCSTIPYAPNAHLLVLHIRSLTTLPNHTSLPFFIVILCNYTCICLLVISIISTKCK